MKAINTYTSFKPITPVTINIIEIIFIEVILSLKKKYPISIENKMLDSLKAPTIGIGAWVNPHTTMI